jgi:hypothetical protein
MLIKFANCSASVAWQDASVMLVKDQAWDAADPFVQGRPEFFDNRPEFVHHTMGHVPGSADEVEQIPASGVRRRSNRG